MQNSFHLNDTLRQAITNEEVSAGVIGTSRDHTPGDMKYVGSNDAQEHPSGEPYLSFIQASTEAIASLEQADACLDANAETMQLFKPALVLMRSSVL